MKHLHLTLGLTAIVDDIDYDRCRGHRWRAHGGKWTWYARNERDEFLHRFVLGEPPFDGAMVDHINHHGWDNTRENLRWVTQATNDRNRRGADEQYAPFIGIRRAGGRWQYWSALFHRWVGSYEDCLAPALQHDREALSVGCHEINFPCLIGETMQSYRRTHDTIPEGI